MQQQTGTNKDAGTANKIIQQHTTKAQPHNAQKTKQRNENRNTHRNK